MTTELPRPAHPPAARIDVDLRVRYHECDSMGVAHHASYVPWLEAARTELLRSAGVTYAQMERAGVFLAVAKLECSYRRPVYYDDVLRITARVVSGSRVKIAHEYEIRVAEGSAGARQVRSPDEVVTRASTLLVCVTREGEVRPLPDWMVPEQRG